MITEIVLTVTELIGSLAFAVSGALAAIDRKLDAFGVLFIGCVTATGGGIIRDMMLGITPPAVFSHLYILGCAMAAALVVFVIAYINRSHYHTLHDRLEAVNNIFDAVGLASFSVMGTETAISHGVGDNIVLTIFIGMLTGVGGGILRDVMTDSTPYVFKKHIYALASVAGSAVYYVLVRAGAGTPASTFVSMALVIAIRLLATYYRWSLPRIHIDTDKKL